MQETVRKSDEELVALAQGGDQRATEELLFRHTGVVRCCARGFFLIGGETEDLIQEGMIGLYHAIVDYKFEEGGSSFKNFAYLCVSRRIIDAVKAAARKKNEPLNGGVALEETEGVYSELNLSPEDLLIISDERRELKHKMSRALSDFEFKITSMYVDGMTCAEICEATGKDMKSVDNAIQRSKRKLQKILKK
ncbi:MAG: sigma-70 family RNA polymerase sigma factor [Clostridia bacterium]|nr:sigma-70 family RNA polymerase sigma factor [Clostridia bacterium]